MKKIIGTIDQLKKLAYDREFECRILLNGGCFSRKYISYDPTETDGYLWRIVNSIDDTIVEYRTDKELIDDYPLFFEAMKYGALIYD